MHKVFILLMVFCVGCVGCSSEEPTPHQKKLKAFERYQERQSKINHLTYHKDHRTGLCYAVGFGYRSGYLATVPCDKVKAYLKKRPVKIPPKTIVSDGNTYELKE